MLWRRQEKLLISVMHCSTSPSSRSLSGSSGSRSVLEMTLGSSVGFRCAGSGGSVPWIKDDRPYVQWCAKEWALGCVISPPPPHGIRRRDSSNLASAFRPISHACFWALNKVCFSDVAPTAEDGKSDKRLLATFSVMDVLKVACFSFMSYHCALWLPVQDSNNLLSMLPLGYSQIFR